MLKFRNPITTTALHPIITGTREGRISGREISIPPVFLPRRANPSREVFGPSEGFKDSGRNLPNSSLGPGNNRHSHRLIYHRHPPKLPAELGNALWIAANTKKCPKVSEQITPTLQTAPGGSRWLPMAPDGSRWLPMAAAPTNTCCCWLPTCIAPNGSR